MLAALCRYYDCLRRQPDSDMTPEGYSGVTVNYNVVLTVDGTLKAILPYTQTKIVGKKTIQVGRREIFPFRNSIPGIAAETIDHRGKYLFGMEWENERFAVSKKSLQAFGKCREKNETFLAELSSPVVDAYRAFLAGWKPEEETENPVLTALGKDFNLAKFIVTTEADLQLPLNRDPEMDAAWERHLAEREVSVDAVFGQCAVSGEIGPIARIHDNLSGVPGGLSTGTGFVNMKTSAFWSYGKRESFNSGVSEESMRKYTKAFNYLTSSAAHRQMLEDMSLYFWVETSDSERPYLEAFGFSFGGPSLNSSAEEEEKNEREQSELQLASIFRALAEGREANWQAFDVDGDAPFYLLGIKPNASRLAIKLYEKNSFGKLMENAARHHRDIGFSPEDKQLSVWQIDKALQSPVAPAPLQQDLLTGLLKSIYSGLPYPFALLTTAVRRAKTDRDDGKGFYSVNRTRARIIKACLIRTNYIKGEQDMLNTNCEDTAYQCGRLFALLENIQRCALGDINASIKDKFFSSACSTPSLVLPRLIKLAQPHLKKISNEKGGKLSGYFERQIGEIAQKLSEGFPKTLGIEQQGMFELGYYAQRFAKRAATEENEEMTEEKEDERTAE